MMYQLLIVGGGAAGLAAAVRASACGLEHIAILERSPRTGRKILASGNGRCNLSHADISAGDYSGSVSVKPVLDAFGDACAFFASIGLLCRTDDAGRMYPYSMAASSVLDVLRTSCLQSGVEELCGQEAVQLCRKNSYWEVVTGTGRFRAKAVLLAFGGFAAPRLGTDGSAWNILRHLHVPLVAPHPILCPVLSDPAMLRSLKGLRVRGTVSLMDGKELAAREEGEIQFTQNALSGICLFNLSGSVDIRRVKDFFIHIDILPGMTEKDTIALLYGFAAVRSQAQDLLSGIVQKPLAQVILKQAAVEPTKSCISLSGRQIAGICAALHDLMFPVNGVGSWEQAQATAGGIPGYALGDDLQIKGQPGLYAAGEVLDVHSICGGYHLHWCWSSGTYAAGKIAERILQP